MQIRTIKRMYLNDSLLIVFILHSLRIKILQSLIKINKKLVTAITKNLLLFNLKITKILRI